MVKLSEGKYQCEWCGTMIEWKKRIAGSQRSFGGSPYDRSAGHSRVAAQLLCPKCPGIRYVSQKTKLELQKK